MIRGISTPNYATESYQKGDPARLLWEPVFICDSRLLCTMMLRAWRDDAAVEMRRQLYRDLYGTEPVGAVERVEDAVT